MAAQSHPGLVAVVWPVPSRQRPGQKSLPGGRDDVLQTRLLRSSRSQSLTFFCGFSRGRRCRGLAALTHCLVHNDGTGDRYVKRRNLACHGNPQEVIAGFFDQVVEAGALAAEDEDTVAAEVVLGVVGRAALVESEDPDVLLLHLLEGADQVGNAGDTDVLGGSGGGFGYGRSDGGGAALGEDDAIDAGAVGGPEQGSEVVRVFDAVEGEEEPVVPGFGWSEKVLDSKELTLADDGEHALVGIGAGEAGELVPGFEGDADTGFSAELDEAFEAFVFAFACHADVVELPGTGADGLLDWVEAVENFHPSSLLSKWKKNREALECL